MIIDHSLLGSRRGAYYIRAERVNPLWFLGLLSEQYNKHFMELIVTNKMFIEGKENLFIQLYFIDSTNVEKNISKINENVEILHNIEHFSMLNPLDIMIFTSWC